MYTGDILPFQNWDDDNSTKVQNNDNLNIVMRVVAPTKTLNNHTSFHGGYGNQTVDKGLSQYRTRFANINTTLNIDISLN